MQAFRLRGIVPDGASSFTEDSLRWTELSDKVSEGGLPRLQELSFEETRGRIRQQVKARAKVLTR